MPDTITPVTQQITKLISSGVAEDELLAAVVRKFPNISTAELSAALQDATAEAEKKALRPH
jgi:hypothetical protein